MISKPKEKPKLSIRSVKLEGGSPLEGQARGSDALTIEYWINITTYDPEMAKTRELCISKGEIVFNGQFKDEEFKEAIIYFKKLAVKALKESNVDHGVCIDEAIDQINSGN